MKYLAFIMDLYIKFQNKTDIENFKFYIISVKLFFEIVVSNAMGVFLTLRDREFDEKLQLGFSS